MVRQHSRTNEERSDALKADPKDAAAGDKDIKDDTVIEKPGSSDEDEEQAPS